jgi:glycerol transport system ATP-binding protein
VLHEGRLLQYGPTADVFRRPESIRVARAFSDPPINLIAGADGTTIGIRAGMLRLEGRDRDLALRGTVELAEMSGSDTFVHVDTPVGELVAQLAGVHVLKLGEALTLHYDPSQALVFDRSGNLA